MNHDEAINDLGVLKEYFEQEADAFPVCLEYAIEWLIRYRWIPVSERLPEEGKRYLVTLPLVNGYPWVTILYYGEPNNAEECLGTCWYYSGYCDIAVDGVTAWMPLPEAYKEGNKDERK